MLRGSFKNISRYGCVLPHIYLRLRQVWNIFASHYPKSWIELISPRKKALWPWTQRNIKNTSNPEFSFKVIRITNKKKLFNICFLLSIFLCRDFFCLKGSFYVLIIFMYHKNKHLCNTLFSKDIWFLSCVRLNLW